MVIQSNMTPQSIVMVWEETEEVFNKFGVSIVSQPLKVLVNEETLGYIMSELNSKIKSSSNTCIEGG